MEPYHTGVKVFDWEITISQRGGVGVKTVPLYDIPGRYSHETEETFKHRLLTAAINAGLALAQHQLVSYAKR